MKKQIIVVSIKNLSIVIIVVIHFNSKFLNKYGRWVCNPKTKIMLAFNKETSV